MQLKLDTEVLVYSIDNSHLIGTGPMPFSFDEVMRPKLGTALSFDEVMRLK